MDLFAHCLFNAAHLGTIEKQHGSSPTDEHVVKESRLNSDTPRARQDYGECNGKAWNDSFLAENPCEGKTSMTLMYLCSL